MIWDDPVEMADRFGTCRTLHRVMGGASPS